MGTQIVPFAQAPVPAHVQKFVETHSNIDPRNTVNQLSFRGKVWRQVIDGEENALLNKEDEPVSTVHVVVLNYNKSRSRAYYEGAFEEGKSKPPACWSMDGEAPDPSVKEPQCATCAKCPQAVKGSKITPNGKETTACSVFKRLAVVPLSNLECPPLLLRLAQTSTWDKNNEENEAKGFYAWDQYTDMLRARGALHTGAVATKVRFDSRMAYPKLVFAASRWLTDEELEAVTPLFESDAVNALLNASEVAAAARKPASTETEDDEPAPVKAKGNGKAAKPAEEEEEAPPPKKAKPAPQVVDEEEDDAPPPPKKKAKPAEDDEVDMSPVKARVPAKTKVVKDEDEEAPAPKKKVKPKVEEEEEEEPVAAKPKKAGNGLADLVEEWDD